VSAVAGSNFLASWLHVYIGEVGISNIGKGERQQAPVGASEDRERLAYLHYHGRVDTQHIALDADRDFSWIGAGFIAGGADSSADLQGSGQRITDALDPVALGRAQTVDGVEHQTQLAHGRR